MYFEINEDKVPQWAKDKMCHHASLVLAQGTCKTLDKAQAMVLKTAMAKWAKYKRDIESLGKKLTSKIGKDLKKLNATP